MLSQIWIEWRKENQNENKNEKKRNLFWFSVESKESAWRSSMNNHTFECVRVCGYTLRLELIWIHGLFLEFHETSLKIYTANIYTTAFCCVHFICFSAHGFLLPHILQLFLSDSKEKRKWNESTMIIHLRLYLIKVRFFSLWKKKRKFIKTSNSRIELRMKSKWWSHRFKLLSNLDFWC